MSNYIRDLRSGSAILISKKNDSVVASFTIDMFAGDQEKMRIACNNKWDELDLADMKKEKNSIQLEA